MKGKKKKKTDPIEIGLRTIVGAKILPEPFCGRPGAFLDVHV